MPIISVLMTVYNGEKYLAEAIDSILNQTYKDFELLIICEPSAKEGIKTISSYNDHRIKLIKNEQHLGLIKSLNKGLKMAKGKYVAKMDSDDISLPARLEKQVNFMDSHPEIGISGTWAYKTGTTIKRPWKNPSDYEFAKCQLLFTTVMCHPSVIMRKKMLDKYNLNYPLESKHCEDYALWVEASKHFPISNLEEFLLLYRQHSSQTGKENRYEYRIEKEKHHTKILKEFLHDMEITPTEEELKLHMMFIYDEVIISKNYLKSVENWFLKIQSANKNANPDNTGYFAQNKLENVLGYFWFKVCKEVGKSGLWTWNIFNNSILSKKANLTLFDKIKFLLILILGKLKIIEIYRNKFKYDENF